MQKYVVLVVDEDEDTWEAMSEAEKDLTYQADYRFGALLEERGGRVVGGAGLEHSRHTRVLRKGVDGGALVTDGPYAETAEQLSGFFIVECDSLEDLTEACRLMLPAHWRLELRPCPSA